MDHLAYICVLSEALLAKEVLYHLVVLVKHLLYRDLEVLTDLKSPQFERVRHQLILSRKGLGRDDDVSDLLDLVQLVVFSTSLQLLQNGVSQLWSL